MIFKKEHANLYFVTGSIIASLVFYAVSLSMLQKDIAGGSSLKMYQQQQMGQSRQ